MKDTLAAGSAPCAAAATSSLHVDASPAAAAKARLGSDCASRCRLAAARAELHTRCGGACACGAVSRGGGSSVRARTRGAASARAAACAMRAAASIREAAACNDVRTGPSFGRAVVAGGAGLPKPFAPCSLRCAGFGNGALCGVVHDGQPADAVVGRRGAFGPCCGLAAQPVAAVRCDGAQRHGRRAAAARRARGGAAAALGGGARSWQRPSLPCALQPPDPGGAPQVANSYCDWLQDTSLLVSERWPALDGARLDVRAARRRALICGVRSRWRCVRRAGDDGE